MEQTFGSFIREKRQEKMIKLNTFARVIGISNVYQSYIETGKRPAPSAKILNNIAQALNLDSEETSRMFSLAALTHTKNGFSNDFLSYINKPYVAETLRLALNNGAAEKEWALFRKMIDLKSHGIK